MLERLTDVVCAALLGALALCLFVSPLYWAPPCSGNIHCASSTSPVSRDDINAPKDQPETPRERGERLRKASIDGWTIFIGICTVLILGIQALVFSRQALKLRQSVEAMNTQSADTKLSIAQATRAAVAMEGVAAGIEETVKTNKTVLEYQKDFWSRQMRAYVSVDTGACIRQGRRLRFEFRPLLTNNGNTPANNVRVLSKCELVSALVPSDFDYVLGFEGPGTGSATTLFPRQTKYHANIFVRKLTIGELRPLLVGKNAFHLWGQVTYDDVFNTPRYTNFSYIIYMPTNKRGAPTWNVTDQHNDAD